MISFILVQCHGGRGQCNGGRGKSRVPGQHHCHVPLTRRVGRGLGMRDKVSACCTWCARPRTVRRHGTFIVEHEYTGMLLHVVVAPENFVLQIIKISVSLNESSSIMKPMPCKIRIRQFRGGRFVFGPAFPFDCLCTK